MYKEENIRKGFKMNRNYAELKKAAEALRYPTNVLFRTLPLVN